MHNRRLIDTHAHTFDVSDTRVVPVDAQPAAVLAAVERVELSRTVVRAIEALGLADRLALSPTRLESRSGGEHVYGMAGRLDGVPAERVDPHDLGARFVCTDNASRERLRAAWGALGPASAALSKRALAAVKRYAEESAVRQSRGHVPYGGQQRLRRWAGAVRDPRHGEDAALDGGLGYAAQRYAGMATG
jgi:hypothetical protein